MFLIISNKDRVRAGAELREKNPRWRLWGIVLLFKNFSLLFFCGGGRDHTEGRQGGTTTLGLDWVIQEKIASCPVPMPERKQQQQQKTPTHLELCTDSIMWARIRLLSGSQQWTYPACQAACRTHFTKIFPQKPFFPFGRF